MGRVIRDVTKKEIRRALEEEVRLTLEQEGRGDEYEKWERGEEITRVKLTGSFDMGWNKRSSGNRYDSNSGHAFIIGALSGKVICMRVYSKTCRICQYANKTQTIATAHECAKNYEGSSKSMEVQSILEMTINYGMIIMFALLLFAQTMTVQ